MLMMSNVGTSRPAKASQTLLAKSVAITGVHRPAVSPKQPRELRVITCACQSLDAVQGFLPNLPPTCAYFRAAISTPLKLQLLPSWKPQYLGGNQQGQGKAQDENCIRERGVGGWLMAK